MKRSKVSVRLPVCSEESLIINNPDSVESLAIKGIEIIRAEDCSADCEAEQSHICLCCSGASCEKGNGSQVSALLEAISNVLDLCRQHRLSRLYFTTLHKCLNERDFQEIIEEALVYDGNDDVLAFYRDLLERLDDGLLGDQREELDLACARIFAHAKLKRNMRFEHRSIQLAEEEEKRLTRYRVSVIIPVYNTAAYLAQCMDSIVRQTLKEIEIICIDDGSTDGSADILAAYERKYSNVFVYHQENQGLSAARNAGMQHAHGMYVYFMDSDDILEGAALEALLSCAQKENLDVVYFSAQAFLDAQEDGDKTQKAALQKKYHRNENYPEVMTGREMLAEQCRNSEYLVPVWSQFYRTEFLRCNNLAFYEQILHEDNLYTLQAALCADRVRTIPDVFFHRRIRNGSIMLSPLSYRNLLGYFVFVAEALRMQPQHMRREEFEALYSRIRGVFLHEIIRKWRGYHKADRTLFLASLTIEDRNLFMSLFAKAIELYEKQSKCEKELQDSRKKKAECERQAGEMKKAHESLVDELKKAQTHQLQQIRHEHELRIEALKGICDRQAETLRGEHERQIVELKNVYDQEMETLKGEHERRIGELKRDYARQIESLKSDHEQKIKRLRSAMVPKSSLSYRIGRVVTWFPRRLRSLIKQ